MPTLVQRRACPDKPAMRIVTAPLRMLADLALPPRCPGCGVVTAADHRFCADCWRSLRFLGPPWCAACHVPFDHDRGDGARCGRCLASPPPHDGVRAAVAYGAVARSVALRLKYGGRLSFGETVAQALARLMPADAELIVPVPLHRWRLWSRGYNQAALIASALGRASGIPVDVRLLVRTRATPVLRAMGPRQRARAVAGAFAVTDPAPLRGRSVVLVDDIHTSGATTDACTRVLKRAGAARVVVLCWARVLDDSGLDAGLDD